MDGIFARDLTYHFWGDRREIYFYCSLEIYGSPSALLCLVIFDDDAIGSTPSVISLLIEVINRSVLHNQYQKDRPPQPNLPLSRSSRFIFVVMIGHDQ